MYYVSNRVANLLFPNLSEDCMQCTGVRPTKSDNVSSMHEELSTIWVMINATNLGSIIEEEGIGNIPIYMS